MQQGGSQYGVPPSEMAPFTATATGGARSQLLGGIPSSDNFPSTQPMAEAVPPINSRPPQPQAPPPNTANLEELATTVSGNFHDDEALTVGDEAERSGTPGNRWPREETLALIKIRSDMDATFRDATLKGPLWDEVSRKLAEQGYTRSAKKCKEKFENVHKYYKRTKEGRAGRQDGKSYRFFAQLEALHNIGTGSGGGTAGTPTNHQSTSAAAFGMSGARFQPAPLSSVAPLNANPRHVTDQFDSGSAPTTGAAAAAVDAGISFSTNSSSSESSATDGEDTEEGLVGRKRKKRSSGGGSRKTMAFFKDLMKQLMDQQETMQQRFLETIEKREQDRMIREEAWKRQEMARLTREHEAMAQERAMSATRDTAIITFLQKITGQTIQLPQPIPVPATATPPHATAPVATQPPPQQPSPQPKHHLHHQHRHQQNTETSRSQPNPETNIVVHDQHQEMGIGGSGTDPASSRWPKTEVHALIKLRSAMESRYQDAGPKGPLWEEISTGMKQMGFTRSAKRCKEKWENINKYFKKVKESNKKRPEDAKTCPYFYQLDALYRKKSLAGAGSASGNSLNQTKEGQQEPNQPNSQLRSDVLPILTLPPPPPQPPQEHPADPEENGNGGNNKGASTAQTSNGDPQTGFFQENTGGSAAMKKPEDIMKELIMEQQQTTGIDDYDKDSDNMDDEEEEEEEEDDDDEDEEEQKMAYKIEYQRPNVGSASNGGGASSSVAGVAAAGSFLAMVQ